MKDARFGWGRKCLVTLGPVALVMILGCQDPNGPVSPGPSFVAGSSSLKAPSKVSALASSESAISLSWQDNSQNETGFEIHGSTTGAAGTFTRLATVGANIRTYVDQGLSALTQYCYKVRAIRVSTYSAFSNTACATTLAPPATLIADSWAYTEALTNGDGQVCHDTGSFVFTPSGSGFTGTVERVGNCVSRTWFHPEELEPPGTLHPIQNGIVSSSSVSFEVLHARPVCSLTVYGGSLSGNPPDQMSGTAGDRCGWWSGTWQARRRPSVASVALEPPGDGTLVPGNTRQLLAVARAADGLRLVGRPVEWSSANPMVATVSPGGQVSAVATGLTAITAMIEGHSSSVQVTVERVSFAAIFSGWYQTCGLTATGKAYCWGSDGFSGLFRLGDGIGAPAAVIGGLAFRDIGGGYYHTCGVTLVGAAYCWGRNYNGGFGDGSSDYRYSLAPVAVAGGLTFTEIDAGWDLSCGLTSAGAAYCWGYGSPTPSPVYTAQSLAHLELSASEGCALASGGVPYCWNHLTANPSPAVNDLTFSIMALGGSHRCGLAESGVPYCWGLNQYGQLGSPPTGEVCEVGVTEDGEPILVPCSTTPVPVAGELRFIAVSAGSFHTCALTALGAAYCWGDNTEGQLGTGSTGGGGPTPIAVAGGHLFTQLSAGAYHTCALATDGALYCWGLNGNGQLGTGTTSVNVPAKVAGQP